MKILFLADEESKMYWEYFKKEDFKGIDIIVSCGDLNPSYLSFLTTMVGVPLLYVHGNHDDKYNVKPPEGCICIEDEIYEYEGVRFLGLGGSNRFDVLVTHSPAKGLHDGEDTCHTGFDVFNRLIEQYKPRYFVHGHVHMSYGRQFVRLDKVGETTVINAYEKYIVEI